MHQHYHRVAGPGVIWGLALLSLMLMTGPLLSGNTSPDQKEPTPFIIEWIPDILPKSHIGELRIKFEYGHQRNGQIESRAVPSHTAPTAIAAVAPVEIQTALLR